MKKDFKSISIRKLAALVIKQLALHDIEAVLTGGACVTIYSFNIYQSLDLDFVTNAAEYRAKEIKEAMRELGFALAAEGFFARKDCPYIIEFIPPPLAIGSEPVRKKGEIKTREGRIYLLTPTDCVKDRLAAFYHWNDRQSLKQALLVAQKQKIDLKEIKRWSDAEGQAKKFAIFRQELLQKEK